MTEPAEHTHTHTHTHPNEYTIDMITVYHTMIKITIKNNINNYIIY